MSAPKFTLESVRGGFRFIPGDLVGLPNSATSEFRHALENAGVTVHRETNGTYYVKNAGQYIDHLCADTRADAWDEVTAMFRHWCRTTENIPVVCAALAKAVQP